MLRALRVALSIAMLCTLLVPSGVRGADAPAPYEINAILSLTGPGAFIGAKEAEALRAIEGVTNKNGGVGGRPVKFVVADDQTNPQVTVQLANGLIAKKVPLILGPTVAATCGALAPLIAAGGPLVYCYSAAIHPADGTYMFAATVSSADLLAALMRYLHARNLKKLALITATDAAGQDVAHQLELIFAEPQNRDLSVVVHEVFNPADISVAAQMARVKAAKPQALLTASTGSPFATVLHGAFDTGLDIPIFANGSNMTFSQMTQYATFLPHDLLFTGDRGIAVEGRGTPRAVLTAQTTFTDTLRALGSPPEFGHLLAWDAAMLSLDMLRQLGLNASATQLRERLAQLHEWNGILGTYDFRKISQRGVGLESAMIFRWEAAKSDFVAVSRPGGETSR
jgi:branched-chain amino acid transport system substrate-binding protein